MHLEMTNKICALCKRLVTANGHSDSARLCEQCRALIQTILPKANSSSFVAVEQAQTFPQSQLATARMAQPSFAGPASFEEDLGDVEIIAQSGHYELASFDPVADFDEVHTDRISDVETEYFDEFEADDEAAHMPAASMRQPVDVSISQAVEPAAHEPEVFIMFDQPEDFHNDARAFEAEPFEKLSEPDLSRDEKSAQSYGLPQASETNEQAVVEVETLTNVEAVKDAEAVSDTETTSYQEAVDPWDDPLPAWEQSRNEYPLSLGLADRKRRSRRKLWLAPAVVLVCMVAAFLIFRSSDNAPQNQQAVGNSEQGEMKSATPAATSEASDSTKPASDGAGQAAPPSSESQAVAAIETKKAPLADAATNSGAETEWRHALQALASTSQDEARAFAEKLTGAGIPAYVISADLANRGKWFRVRIGGFNTAQDALKFAAEARLRAKAAGLALKDLNVVDYLKP